MKIKSSNLYFYQGGTLASGEQGTQTRTILRGADMPLAEQHSEATQGTELLAANALADRSPAV